MAPLAAAQDSAPLTLTLARSMELAVQNNLSVKLARARTDEAGADVTKAAAGLLPHLTASAGESRTFRQNLDAMGFEGYGFLGPFNTFDARIALVQEVFNWNTHSRLRSARHKERSAKLRLELAREQVCAAAALAYIEVLRAQAATDAAKADERLASELLTLAKDRHAAGTATGLDVAREQTRVAQEHSRVLYAQVSVEDALLRLKHVAGIRLVEDLMLSDSLAVSSSAFPDAGQAVAGALKNRLELAIGDEELQAAAASLSAEQGRRIPSLQLTGSAGISGNEPDSKSGSVGDLGVRLALPLFTGREISGAVAAARAAREEVAARVDDMRTQVEEDVRLSLKNLTASVEQAETAALEVSLAQQELEMAQGRFAAGVGDNVELVNAQTALSLARAVRVSALAAYNNSQINLALALGRMRLFSLHAD